MFIGLGLRAGITIARDTESVISGSIQVARFFREHIVLLDNVEQFGFGNWPDVAKAVSEANGPDAAPRTPKEAEEEFHRQFILGAIG